MTTLRCCNLKLLMGCGAGLLLLGMVACSGQQAPSAAGTTGNQVAMNFDLNACENLGPGLYRCPGSDKPICDPGYNKGDVECLKVDKNGVLIREGM